MKNFLLKRLAMITIVCGVTIGVFLLTLNAASPVADRVATKSHPVPGLPLLTAIEKSLAELAPTATNVKATLEDAGIVQIVNVTWIDSDSLLVRTEDPPKNGAKQVPIYIWPLHGSPTYATVSSSKRFEFGETTIYNDSLIDAQGHIFAEVASGMETLAITKLTTIQSVKSPPSFRPPVTLPHDLFIPDFGVPDPEAGQKGHPKEVRIYDGSNKLLVRVKRPPTTYLYPNGYYLHRDSNSWTMGIPAMSKRPGFIPGEHAETDVSILLIDEDGRVKSTLSINRSDFSLLNFTKLALQPKQRIEALSSLDHPDFSPLRRRWLFRKVGNINILGPNAEKAAFAELWSCDAAGGNRHLVDIQGWYNGPESHQYAFFIQNGRVQEQFRRFKNWGAYREMIPAVSPDGRSVAYIKDNQICIAKVPQ